MYFNSMGEMIMYKKSDLNGFLDIPLAGITMPNPNYFITHNLTRKFLYDQYVFEFITDGVGYIEAEGKKYKLVKGDAYFLNKLRPHTYYPDKKNPYKKYFVCLKGSLLDNLIRAYEIEESLIIRKVNILPILENILKFLGEHIIRYDLITLEIVKLFQMIKPRSYTLVEKEHGLAQKIKAYLDANLCSQITLDDISANLHISKSHIERTFREEYNESPLKYFYKEKIAYACTLLVNTSQSVTSISDYLSFSNPKYFSKCVKQMTGLSPIEYRKSKLPAY